MTCDRAGSSSSAKQLVWSAVAFGAGGAAGTLGIVFVAPPSDWFVWLAAPVVAVNLLWSGGFVFGLAVVWTRECVRRRVPTPALGAITGVFVGAGMFHAPVELGPVLYWMFQLVMSAAAGVALTACSRERPRSY